MGRNNQPLAGKQIVVTRAPDQAPELIRALEALGAEVLLLPTISFAPPEDWQALDNELRNLPGFDAILFLSRNAVRYIFERVRYLGVKCEILQSSKFLVAAVGEGTAQALASEGVYVNFVPKNQSGEALVKELGPSLVGRKILLPRSDRGDDRIPRALREAGAEVTAVIAYRTTAPEALDPEILSRIRSGKVDAMLFASPSAFHNLSASLGAAELRELSSRVHFAAIGPTTARALREEGMRVEIEAAESSAAGLAESLAKFFEHQPSGVRRP